MPNTSHSVSRRSCLGLMGAGAISSLPGAAARPSAGRPNVLIVLADQFPAYATGYAGDPNARTPYFDRLAREGVRFVNALSNCPVSTPYRAMLQTGRRPLSTGMIANDLRLPESERTIAEVFADAGYQTGYIGKWHLDGPDRAGFTPPGPRRQGYQFWAVNNCNHNYTDTFYYRDTPQPIPVKGYEPVVQTRLFLEFLSARDRRRPFFMQISWGPPHPPYRQIPEELRVFRPEQIRLRPNMVRPNREFLADFYSHIAALDAELGRILAALEQEGLLDQTVVLFTADHGDMLGCHDKWDKQIWYEESVNVPFLLRYPPRVPAGRSLDALLDGVDVMPTLLGLAGLRPPPAVEGRDLSGLFSGRGARERPASLLAAYMPFARQAFHYPEWRAVRTKTHTYVESRAGPLELYDNRRDPYQMDNLVGRREAAALQAELAGRLRRLLAEAGDRFEPREAYWKRYRLDIGEFGEVRYSNRRPGAG